MGLEDPSRNLFAVVADLFQERPDLVELLLDQVTSLTYSAYVLF